VHLKSSESEVVLAERRAKARERRNADRYASVPVFKEDMPVVDDPDAAPTRGGLLVEDPDDLDDYDDEDAVRRPSASTEAMGRGRTAPTSPRPVGESRASGRQQPTRQPRSKRK